jgi:hypothetical protein
MTDACFTQSPRLNLDSCLDTLDPVGPAVPLALTLTMLLLGAVALCWIYGALPEPRGDNAPKTVSLRTLFCSIGGVMMPFIALTYSPFLVPTAENELGLGLRLLTSLTIPASILIPGAMMLMPLHRCVKGFIVLALTAVFTLTPPYWKGFSGPPVDGGLLHQAMEDVRDLVPEGAVIVVDRISIGNMVTALWGKPRIIAGRYDPPCGKRNCHRLVLLSPQVIEALDDYTHAEPSYPAPLVVLGPWLLLKEELYRAFREHLRVADPELAAELEHGKGPPPKTGIQNIGFGRSDPAGDGRFTERRV